MVFYGQPLNAVDGYPEEGLQEGGRVETTCRRFAIA
jgi:hypothetical protein